MANYVFRLILPAFFSLSGFMATMYWYKHSDTSRELSQEKKPIAILVSGTNEVQRKPVQRLIWEPIAQEELLYPGEQVKTSSISEAKIEFIKSGILIELEPDSLVVLEENNDKVSLDFMKGSLFVKNQDGTGEGGNLEIKSGNKTVDASKATMTLSKSESGELGLNVLKGRAQASVSGKTLELTQDKAGVISANGLSESAVTLKTIFPNIGETVYFDPKSEGVTFKWAPLPTGYTVLLELGKTRKDMKPVSGISAKGEDGKLTSKIKIGRNYWRLVAASQENKDQKTTSLVIANDFKIKAAPILESPENNSVQVIGGEQKSVEFKWSSVTDWADILFEVSSKEDFKNTLISQRLNESASGFSTTDLTTQGAKFWRVVGYMKSGEAVTSAIYKFDLKVFAELPAPILISPNQNKTLTLEDAKKGLFLNWAPVIGAAKYNISFASIKDGKTIKTENFETKTAPYRLSNPSAGNFSWNISTVSKSGQMSKPSETRTFAIEEVPELKWSQNSNSHLYSTVNPSINLSWERGPANATKWNYKFAKKGEDLAQVPWSTISSQQILLNLPENGPYLFQAEAIDSSSKSVARTTVREILVEQAPLLPAPIYAKEVPEEIKAKKNGSAEVAWQSVEGAQHYLIEVKNATGSKVREVKAQRGPASIPNLLPGNYKLSLRSVDQSGRVGPAGEERPLEVPNSSDVKAPKFKGLKIK